LVPKTTVHSALTVTPFGKPNFVLNTAFKPQSGLTVGAEVSGPTTFNQLKMSIGAGVTVGNIYFGSKVHQDTSTGNSGAVGYVAISEGSVDAVASIGHTFGKNSMPSATLVARHTASKNVWVKAAVTDNLNVRAAVFYRVSPLFSTTFGVGADPAAKTQADRLKMGLKLSFAL